MMSRIIIDPMVRHGKPVIKGTRVPIGVILDLWQVGCLSTKLLKSTESQRRMFWQQ